MTTRIAMVALALAALTAGCNKDKPATSETATPETADKTASKEAEVQTVSINDVAGYVKDNGATIVDANNADTRKEYGVIPGAVLLTSSDEYQVNELPADKAKKLVFYCGGTMCRASDKAAARAATAGYKDVKVLREGIKGWKGAGQPTNMPQT